MMRSRNTGFTLVELAIVITIIGLLIGGVLKGQEMIKIARINSTVQQIQGLRTAVTVFQDVYKQLPGDMKNPGTFIKNCTIPACNTSGNGDGYIVGGYVNTSNTDEHRTFWLQLANADLITGIDTSGTWTGGAEPGAGTPTASIGGGIGVVCYARGTMPCTYYANYGAADYYWPMNNNVFFISGHFHQITEATRHVFTPLEAWMFDEKIDDGKPLTGATRPLFNYSGFDVATNTYKVIEPTKLVSLTNNF